MLQKIKDFYANHTMWVNIGGGVLLVVVGYFILRKKK